MKRYIYIAIVASAALLGLGLAVMAFAVSRFHKTL